MFVDNPHTPCAYMCFSFSQDDPLIRYQISQDKFLSNVQNQV